VGEIALSRVGLQVKMLVRLLNRQVGRILDASFIDLDSDADREKQRIVQATTISETERV
jgi:hypothetical protein